MAYRRFHVPLRYAEYSNLDPSRVLHELKQDIIKKYRNIARGTNIDSGSKAAAAELQTFFQTIKTMSAEPKTAIDSLEDEIIYNIINQARALVGLRKTLSLFSFLGKNGKEQGERFERELSAVIAATLNLAGESQYSVRQMYSRIQLGTASTNIQGMKKAELSTLVDDFSTNLINQVGKQLPNVIKQQLNTKKATAKLVTKEVSNKIDVSGKMAEVTITVAPTTYLYKIATLLKDASFSAKSYSSLRHSWQEKLKTTIYSIAERTSIHLGSTAQVRILLDIFNTRYPYPVSLSFYIVLSKSRNQQIRQDLSQLRFIYELTGYGQTFVNKKIQEILASDGINTGANYLIYNDPGSMNIYVKSTAEIIDELINYIDDLIRSGGTFLNKSYFWD